MELLCIGALSPASPEAGLGLGKRSDPEAKDAERAECRPTCDPSEECPVYADGAGASRPFFAQGMSRDDPEAKTEDGAMPYSSASAVVQKDEA